MPGVHKNNTIAFRPSEWERILIEERSRLSGLTKKDFIARSCIYSNICVTGTRANIQRIVDSVEEMKYTMESISSGIAAGDFPLSEDAFNDLQLRYYAMCVTIVDILDGASYLFGHATVPSSVLSKQERLTQLLESLDNERQVGDMDTARGYLGDKKNETPETTMK